MYIPTFTKGTLKKKKKKKKEREITKDISNDAYAINLFVFFF